MSRSVPISEERLDALRTLDLDVLMPVSSEWSKATRERVERWLAQLAPVLTELLDEIDDLDDALEASETEVALLRPPARRAEIGGIRMQPFGERWRTHWREGSVRHSETFLTRQQAEGFTVALRAQARMGGAR